MSVELVDIDSLRPSTYNPRQTDSSRLDLIELSLRKLGFLLPIYADENGEILSGHQRHLVAKRMGCKVVPRELVKIMTLEKRKAINIVFNRGTNDFRMADDTHSILNEFSLSEIKSMSQQFLNIDIESEDFFPCINSQKLELKKVYEANLGNYNPYARNLARSLYAENIVMPLIVDSELKIINGVGRLHLLASKKHKTIECVFIDNDKAEFAGTLLNKISMDFDIHNKYKDILRYNSFRRSITNRPGLGKGFYVALYGDKTTKSFRFTPDVLKRWKGYYGKRILDFGAGHLTDSTILTEHGIEVTPFEPYKITPGTNSIDKNESIQLTQAFLRKVESKYIWQSLFISSVLNSVPFFEDRKHIVTILAACTSENTNVFAWAMDTTNKEWQNPEREYLSEKAARSLKFRLHYENGVMLGGFSNKPKVQKYHSAQELYELFSSAFADVKIKKYPGNLSVIAKGARFSTEDLRKALEFEFNLPYPDGTSMGVVDEAIKAFEIRLNKKL